MVDIETYRARIGSFGVSGLSTSKLKLKIKLRCKVQVQMSMGCSVQTLIFLCMVASTMLCVSLHYQEQGNTYTGTTPSHTDSFYSDTQLCIKCLFEHVHELYRYILERYVDKLTEMSLFYTPSHRSSLALNIWTPGTNTQAALENDFNGTMHGTCSYLIGNVGSHTYHGNPPKKSGPDIWDLHSDMVLKLSETLAPDTGNKDIERKWRSFANMLCRPDLLSSVEVGGLRDMYDVFRILMDKGKIDYGNYEVVKRILSKLQLMQCCNIITDYEEKMSSTSQAGQQDTVEVVYSRDPAASSHKKMSSGTVSAKISLIPELLDKVLFIKDLEKTVKEVFNKGLKQLLHQDRDIPEGQKEVNIQYKLSMENVKEMKEKLQNKGIDVDELEDGCLQMTFTYSSYEALHQLYTWYTTKELHVILHEGLITEYVLNRLGVTSIKLDISISEEYFSVLFKADLRRDDVTAAQVRLSRDVGSLQLEQGAIVTGTVLGKITLTPEDKGVQDIKKLEKTVIKIYNGSSKQALEKGQYILKGQKEETNQYERSLKHVQNMKEKFQTTGIDVDELEDDCLQMTFTYSSYEALHQLYTWYTTKELHDILYKGLITEDVLNELGVTSIKLDISISEEYFFPLFKGTVSGKIFLTPEQQDDVRHIKDTEKKVEKIYNKCLSQLLDKDCDVIKGQKEANNEYKVSMKNVKKMKKKFKKQGIDVDKLEYGCLQMTFTYSSYKALHQLYTWYTTKELHNILHDGLITEDVLNQLEVTSIKLDISISEEYFSPLFKDIYTWYTTKELHGILHEGLITEDVLNELGVTSIKPDISISEEYFSPVFKAADLRSDDVTTVTGGLSRDDETAATEKLSRDHVTATTEKLSRDDVTAATERLSRVDVTAATERLSRDDETAATKRLSRDDVTAATERMSRDDVTAATDRLSRDDVTAATARLLRDYMTTVTERMSRDDVTAATERLSRDDVTAATERLSRNYMTTTTERVSKDEMTATEKMLIDDVTATTEMSIDDETTATEMSIDDETTATERLSRDDMTAATGRLSRDDVTTATERLSRDDMTAATERLSRDDVTTATERLSRGVLTAATERLSRDDVTAATERLSRDDVTTATERLSRDDVTAATERLSRGVLTAATERLSRDDVTAATERLSRDDVTTATERLSRDDMTAATERMSRDDVTAAAERLSKDDVTAATERLSRDDETAATEKMLIDDVTAATEMSIDDVTAATERLSRCDETAVTEMSIDDVTAATERLSRDYVTAATERLSRNFGSLHFQQEAAGTAETVYSRDTVKTVYSWDAAKSVYSWETVYGGETAASSHKMPSVTDTVPGKISLTPEDKEEIQDIEKLEKTVKKIHKEGLQEVTSEYKRALKQVQTMKEKFQTKADLRKDDVTAAQVRLSRDVGSLQLEQGAIGEESRSLQKNVDGLAEYAKGFGTAGTVYSQDTAKTVYSWDTAETRYSRDTVKTMFHGETAASSHNKLPSVDMEASVKVWGNNDKLCYETKGIKDVLQKICSEEHSYICVVGEPGCGKSTAIRHAALYLKDKLGFIIYPVSGPKQFIDYLDPDKAQVGVIDDIIGEYFIDQDKLKVWDKYNEKMKDCLQVHKNTKILFSLRVQLYSELKSKGNTHIYNDQRHVINFSDEEYKLSGDTMQDMLRHYLQVQHVQNIEGLIRRVWWGRAEQFAGCFPLLCKVFSEDESVRVDPEKYFSDPWPALENIFKQIKSKNKHQFCGLLLCGITDLKDEYFSISYKQNKPQQFDSLIESQNLDPRKDLSDIKSALQALDGVYISHIGNRYTLLHSIFQNIVTFLYDDKYYVFKYVTLDFIHTRVRLFSKFDTDDDYVKVFYGDDCVELLVDRMIEELRSDDTDRWEEGVSFIVDSHYIDNKELITCLMEKLFDIKHTQITQDKTDRLFVVCLKSVCRYKPSPPHTDVTSCPPHTDVTLCPQYQLLLSLIARCDCNKQIGGLLWGYPLLLSVHCGALLVTKALVEHQADVNVVGRYKRCVLHLAVDCTNNVDVTKYLLSLPNLKCLNHRDMYGHTPYWWVVNNKSPWSWYDVPHRCELMKLYKLKAAIL